MSERFVFTSWIKFDESHYELKCSDYFKQFDRFWVILRSILSMFKSGVLALVIPNVDQPRSQGPLLLGPRGEREREREPGLATCPLDKWCKGGVFWFQNFVDNIFVTFKERLFGKESRIISIAIIKTCVMFFNSLHFAIPSSIYSNINLKANQVQYLKAIYRGGDVVAVLPREAEWERTLGTRLNLNSSNHWTNFYPV